MKKILLLNLLILASCQKADNKEIKTNVEKFEQKNNSTASNLRATVVPLPNPNDYEVHLQWGSIDKDVSFWSVLRQSANKEMVSLAVLPKEKREYVDKNRIISGTNYTYFIKSLDEDTSLILKADVQIPRDLEIKQRTIVSELNGYQRLFLQKGAKILPQFENLRIEVQEIVSQNGSVQNFELDQEASLGQHGKSGGLIWIRAAKASGILNIFANGERGGQGLAGVPGLSGTAGKKGGDAVFERILFKDHFNFQLIKPNGETTRCIQAPTDGQPGTAGGIGGTGGRGGIGGNSGSVYIEIESPNGLDIRDTFIPGEGGTGGKAGEGGAGGAGGEAGTPDPHGACPKAKAGAIGVKGKEGMRGEEGRKGDIGAKCFKLGNFTYGSCEPFLTQKWSENNR